MTRLLMIDPDSSRARQVAKRLRLRRLEADLETSFLVALTKLEWQRHDLIVVRAGTIDGMTSSEFCATVKQDPALHDVPIVLAGPSGERDATAITRLDAELDGEDPNLLVAEIAAFIERRQEAVEVFGASEAHPADRELRAGHELRIETDVRDGSLAGFLELIELFALALKSGRIVIRSDAHVGPIHILLDHGQLVHAVFGALKGAPAFRRLIVGLGEQAEISYRFEPLPRWKLSTYPRSIRQGERQRLMQQAAESAAKHWPERRLPLERPQEV